jgi:hypothetical protein
MAVAGLLTEMEDRLDIVIDDDEVDGELLETYGSLLAFAEAKRGAVNPAAYPCPLPGGRRRGTGARLRPGAKAAAADCPGPVRRGQQAAPLTVEVMRRLDGRASTASCPTCPAATKAWQPLER